MSEENEFESLFAEFEQTAERGTPPPIPEKFSYSRARHVGAWTRLVRWIVQGPGLLLSFYLIFLTQIVKEPEAGLNLPGALLCLWLIAPLLGKRPLAHPLRMALLLIPSVLFLIMNSAVVRCGIERIDTEKSPIRYLSRAILTSLEHATEPKALVLLAFTAVALVIVGRRLAFASPWVDTQTNVSRWRQVVSYLVVGLSFALLLSFPLAHKLAWSQPWLNSPELGSPVQSMAEEASDDLGVLLPQVLNSPNLKAFNQDQKLGFYKIAIKRLKDPAPLTQRDNAVLDKLTRSNIVFKSSPILAEFGWEAFRRASQDEVSPYMVHTLVLFQVLPQLAASQDLKLWQERISGLKTQPITLLQTDAVMASLVRKSQEHWARPNRQPAPVYLFGQATRFDRYQIVDEIETTVEILLYLKMRKAVGSPDSLVRKLDVQKPWILNPTWHDLFREILRGLHDRPSSNHYLYLDDRQFLKDVLDLKSTKAETGRYPAIAPSLPSEITYRPSADLTSASLEFGRAESPVVVTLP